MCGIAGILSREGNKPGLVGSAVNMSTAMKHRGPDDEGFLVINDNIPVPQPCWSDDTSHPNERPTDYWPINHIEEVISKPASLVMAHRRLSVIDLSTLGHQPMSCDNNQYWIIHNGEIYNYQDIRFELESMGCSFISNSDTEVVLKAYREWGPKAVGKFNGMFAFVIWNNIDKTLFCARDRLGIKPFYYIDTPACFAFASDIKTLTASGLFRPEISIEGLYHSLSFGVAPRPLTAFKHIKALEPGCTMTVSTGRKFVHNRYWNIPLGICEPSLTETKAAELLEAALHDSIEKRLIADVPVGTFMSGGIDSTTVSAIASAQHPGITAFTLAYESAAEAHNELEQARATAAMHPMNHVVRTIKVEEVLNHIEEMISCYEEPYYSLSPNFLISKLVSRNNVKVVFNGLGGDELFAGYSWYNWLPRWRLFKNFRTITDRLAGLGPRWKKLGNLARYDTPDRLHSALLSIWDENIKKKLFSDNAVKDFDSIEKTRELYIEDGLEFTDDIEAFSYMDIKNHIGNHQLNRLDQFTMRFSIEGRFPLLDHNLIELSFRIPSKFKIKNGIQKYLLRKVAGKYIHQSCLEMNKKGFCLPVEIWINGDLKPIVDQKLAALKKRDIFNNHIIDKIQNNFWVNSGSFYQIWQLAALEIWMEQFIDAHHNISAKLIV